MFCDHLIITIHIPNMHTRTCDCQDGGIGVIEYEIACLVWIEREHPMKISGHWM